ncbi:type II CAAX endopeptidase family protein [Paraglaciecola sp.]|uniref:CPBP family intramembrane glutamic endopeptidase n=1 Tax=Paraglaciecola sp. TaxID=1920173 RepID=UPI0030F39640
MTKTLQSIAKVILFWLAFFLVLNGLGGLSANVPQNMKFLLGACVLIVTSMLVSMYLLKTEHSKLSSIGFTWGTNTARRLILGTVLGMAVVGIMLFTLTLFSPITIERVANPDYWNSMGWAALVLFVLALMEEIAFRSYPLVRLSESLGTRASIYITSIVFAFYHGLDPANLLGPGVWGLFFGLAAIKTKGIALPLGLHFGLNFMQSLCGMKPQYANSIWTVLPDGTTRMFASDTVGLTLQCILLIVGVILIECHVRQKAKAEQDVRAH